MKQKSNQEFIQELLKHKQRISEYLNFALLELNKRNAEHDLSKLTEIEMNGFKTIFPKKKHTSYYSNEYKEALQSLQPSIEHHYKNNSHHPEHFSNGINGMNLLDLIEMICDWVSAMETDNEEEINKNLQVNKRRFEIDEQLFSVLKNTVSFIVGANERKL